MAERAKASVVGATTTLERAATPVPQSTPQSGDGSAKTRGGSAKTALSLVRSRYAELPGALQRVAQTVLLDPPAAAEGTIVELAERSGTSVSTVTRFCRAIGLAGFAGLRQGLRDGGLVGGISNGLRDGGLVGGMNNGLRDGAAADAAVAQRIRQRIEGAR